MSHPRVLIVGTVPNTVKENNKTDMNTNNKKDITTEE